MEIIGDNRPLDQAKRRDAQAAARRDSAKSSDAAGTAKPGVAADLGGMDEAAVGRLVEQLKKMEPADVQRIEDLRARIAAGTYTATPDELAEAILGGNR
jgi:anti-sigma28 factor (negative regulator of flagellin synthesis)